ncbi:hypothetical protein GN956_G17380 [Arapaima gigas]
MEEAPWGTFQDELDWCIQQLEKSLLTNSVTAQEEEQSRRALGVLRSKRTPAVTKRQMMQMVFGDYRRRMTDDHETQTHIGQAAVPASNRDEGGFSWIPSDNSFTFSFFPAGTAVQSEETTGLSPPAQSLPGPLISQGEHFTFNFQVPAESPSGPPHQVAPSGSMELAPPAAQGDLVPGGTDNLQESEQNAKTGGSTAEKKKKPRNKKQKPESVEGEKKAAVASQVGASNSAGEPAFALTAEQILARELDWCIEQLELGLRTQKSTPKQMEEASRALKTLRSSKAPLVKKRQVMRAMFGDYRKKMEAEKAKQVKLIREDVRSARVAAVLEPVRKPVFRRTAQSQLLKQRPQEDGPGCGGNTFVFSPSQEEFRFNFF